jgi:hypothetical protein
MPDSDYWYDVGCCDASKILVQGGSQLIAVLNIEVQGWSDLQKEHLAYILGDLAGADELQLLASLADSANPDVAFRAREAMYLAKQHK